MKIPKLEIANGKPKPKINMPKDIKFLQRVRVKLLRSEVIELQDDSWAKFYAGATGTVIRFNAEDGMLVVVLDTGTTLNTSDRIMECFNESDLEPLVD